MNDPLLRLKLQELPLAVGRAREALVRWKSFVSVCNRLPPGDDTWRKKQEQALDTLIAIHGKQEQILGVQPFFRGQGTH